MSKMDYPDTMATELRATQAERQRAQEACEKMGQRIADLESLLHDIDSLLEDVWPSFTVEDAKRIGRIQMRIIKAVSN